MQKIVQNVWALSALVACFAWTSYGDSFTWNGGEGSWDDASNWVIGETSATRVPGVNTTDDSVVLGNVDATIHFPTSVDETKYIGEFYIQGVSPAAEDPSTKRTITLDTCGTSFYYTNTVSGIHPIIRGWKYDTKKGWLTGEKNEYIYLFKPYGSQNVFITNGTMRATNAVLQCTLTPTNTTLVQKQGVLTFSPARPVFLRGAAGGGTTNWTELVVEDGDFMSGIRLLGYSRFIFKSNGTLPTSTIELLPDNDSTGDGYGGGPAEFIMSAGTNKTNYGWLKIGSFGGADAHFTACGTAYIERNGTGTGSFPDLYVVGCNPNSNSSLNLLKKGEATFADSAVYYVKGRNDNSNQYGNIKIATLTNAVGTVTVKDDASVLFDNGYAAVGSGGESYGYLTVEGRGTLKVLGTATTKLLATSVGINLGGTDSKEAVFTIKDSALVETPRVAATTANTRDWYVGNTLKLEGGTLKTSVIEGSELNVVVNNATICARSATTADAPLLAANGVKSFTAEGEKTLTIDTQDYDTYVAYAFPEDLTIVKKGSGTLYVKNSPHAKTIVENGAIEMTEDGGVFGKSWELGEDTELPLPSVTETSEVVLMNFASEEDAQAYAAAYEEHVIRKSGYRVGTISVKQSDNIYQVVVTVEVVTEGSTKTWQGGTDGAKWNGADNWNPSGIPEPDDTLTVSSAATIELPRFGYANTLNLDQNKLALTGSKSELRVTTVSVKGDQSSKEYNVAKDDAVTITAANFKTEDVGFKKTGAGSLTLDLSATPNLVYISSNATDSIRIDEGELAILGSGTITEGSAHIGRSGTCFYDTTLKNTMVGGTDTPEKGHSSLVLDNTGYGRPDLFASRDGGGGGSICVGNFGANAASATASLTLLNGSMICANSVIIGYQPSAQNTIAYLYVTNSTLCAISSEVVGFGAMVNDDQANSGFKVVARLGEGAVVRDVSGGNGDGAIRFGCGLDVAFADGAIVKMSNVPNDSKYAKGWVRSYGRAFGDVSFTSGAMMSFAGGLLFNNYATPDLSESRRLRFIFDGGIFKPLLVDATDARKGLWECRTSVFYAPEYQGFWAGTDGMNVDMSACSRYTIASPVRGEGELVKTGSGTLVMGKGIKPTTSYKNCDKVTEEDLVNEQYFVASGVVTVQNAGGVRVAEGTVELEAGATDTNSTFTVESSCTLALEGNTVALGALKGAGTVSGGTISMLALKPLADSEDAVTLSDITVNKAVIDFGGSADKDTTVRLVKLGSNVSGALSAGSTFRLKAVNTGNSGLNGATCTVDSNGLITAKASASGLLMIVR